MLMPFLPLIGAGISLLGSLFGNNTNTNQQQNQQSATNAYGNTASTVGTSAKGTVSTVGDTTQSSTQNTTGVTTQQQDVTTALSELVSGIQTGEVNRLDPETLAMLTSGVQRMLGQQGKMESMTQQQLRAVMDDEDFDVGGFVSGIMSAATSRANAGLESNINSMRDASGARGSSSSAIAMLEQRLKADTASELAGVRSSATAQGEELRRTGQQSKTQQLSVLSNDSNNRLAQQLQSLMGSRETTTGQNQQTSTGTQQQGMTGTTGTNQTTTGFTQQLSTMLETALQEQLQQQTGEQTQRSNTSSSGTVNQQQNQQNWGDFFKNVGSIFSATF
jgi:hypothetical protein